jgi:flagellar motor switch protein FliM
VGGGGGGGAEANLLGDFGGGGGGAGDGGLGNLFGGGGGGETSGPEVTVYDLTSQDRTIRGRMPTLDIIYERFVRLFRMSLSNSLRKIASISIISTDMLKFGEFVNTLPIPSCMSILRFESLRGPALLVVEAKLAYALVDSYFGGTDRPFTKIEGKEFTRIELSLLERVIQMAIADLEEAWTPVHKSKISYIRTEVNPQFVGIVPPSDVVISSTFEVELENASGTIAIVLPYSTVEPIKGKLNSFYQSESGPADPELVAKMESHIHAALAELMVRLGNAEITVGDLVNLSVGDVIPLTQDADGELDVVVEGVTKFKCHFGVSRIVYHQ